MAITLEDRRNLAFTFRGSWRSNEHLTVWDHAYADYRRRFPGSTVTPGEFVQLCEMRGIAPVAVGGGGDRPHDIRLSIGTG